MNVFHGNLDVTSAKLEYEFGCEIFVEHVSAPCSLVLGMYCFDDLFPILCICVSRKGLLGQLRFRSRKVERYRPSTLIAA